LKKDRKNALLERVLEGISTYIRDMLSHPLEWALMRLVSRYDKTIES